MEIYVNSNFEFSFLEQILNDSLQFGIFANVLTIHFNILYYVII
jgi:hypothetical protein